MEDPLKEAIARDNAEREHIRLRLMAEELEDLAAVQPLLTAERRTEEFPLSVEAWRFGTWLKRHLRKNPTPINTEAGPIYLTADYAETSHAEASAWLDGWRSPPDARHEFSKPDLPRVIRLSLFKPTPTLAEVVATYYVWTAEYYAGLKAAIPRPWLDPSATDTAAGAVPSAQPGTLAEGGEAPASKPVDEPATLGLVEDWPVGTGDVQGTPLDSPDEFTFQLHADVESLLEWLEEYTRYEEIPSPSSEGELLCIGPGRRPREVGGQGLRQAVVVDVRCLLGVANGVRQYRKLTGRGDEGTIAMVFRAVRVRQVQGPDGTETDLLATCRVRGCWSYFLRVIGDIEKRYRGVHAQLQERYPVLALQVAELTRENKATESESRV